MDLNLIAPMNTLGYGVAATNVLKALTEAGVRVSLFPIGNVANDVPEHFHESIRQGMENAKSYREDFPCIRIWHQHDMAQFVGRGQRIGFPIFELDKFTDVEVHHLQKCDELIVCSEWAKEVLKGEGIYPLHDSVHVVNLGVDRDIFYDVPPNTTGPTTFLSIGKWEKRKGHDILPIAFRKAFSQTDNVRLLMCCSNPFLNEEQHHDWMQSYQSLLGNQVAFVPRQNTQEDVARLMQMADVGLFPARAEGWNLELLEMMSCGKTVIATNYSAHTEFCDQNNSVLVDINETEAAHDGIWFHGQGNWAKFDEAFINDFATCMMDMHLRKSSRKTNMVRIEAIETAKRLSWENSAKQIIDILNLNS